MENLLALLMTKKGVLTLCTSALSITVGGIQVADYLHSKNVYDSLNIQFAQAENQDIEYGTTNFDAKTLIENHEGEIITPEVDTTKLGKQTLEFKVTKENQTKTFKKTINVVDTIAPEIELSSESITIQAGEEYNPQDLITTVSDPADGELAKVSEEEAQTLEKDITENKQSLVTDPVAPVAAASSLADTTTPSANEVTPLEAKVETQQAPQPKEVKSFYTVTGEVDTQTPGDYEVVVKAIDKAGNETSKTITVNVKAKKDTKPVEKPSEKVVAQSDVPANAEGNSIVEAAIAQIGVRQSCTALVSNALAAVGINFHGYPSEYISLGTVVSEADAQPGDIIYYDNAGAGTPHVAIYIGGGRAIHGGWTGNTTVNGPAWMGSGRVVIRVNQ